MLFVEFSSFFLTFPHFYCRILSPEDIFASKGAAVKEDGKLLDGTLLQADGLRGEPGKTRDENGAAPTATTKQRGE